MQNASIFNFLSISLPCRSGKCLSIYILAKVFFALSYLVNVAILFMQRMTMKHYARVDYDSSLNGPTSYQPSVEFLVVYFAKAATAH